MHLVEGGRSEYKANPTAAPSTRAHYGVFACGAKFPDLDLIVGGRMI